MLYREIKTPYSGGVPRTSSRRCMLA